ncbi:MAG: TIGR02452 family protein [Clostridia bacterium]|nr:TIGR02452 family protein [Clostridia bacterium]
MTNKQVAYENIELLKNGGYERDGKKQVFRKECYSVEVYSPSMLESLRDSDEIKRCQVYEKCEIYTDTLDTLTSAGELAKAGGKVIALNFASALYAGGGFLHGSYAQEEDLCRRSTLYASLSSECALEMYDYNRAGQEPCYSDYTLLSPVATVFRDTAYEMIDEPYDVAIITCPAPNLNHWARKTPIEEIRRVFRRRIRNILVLSAIKGYDTLVLGAWGCGAFGNDAKDIAKDFYTVLVEEGYQRYFKRIAFSIYVNPRSKNHYNLNAFEELF